MEEIRQKIQTILEETVNTQLAAHNGSASLSDFADGVAWIRFHGACANCMSSSETLEDVVKGILPFLVVMIIVLLLITYIPQISLFLPNLFD